MRVRAAVAFQKNEPLEICTLDLRSPGPGEVLVRMIASGLCHSDLSVVEGKVPRWSFPLVMGHEGSGIVLECGSGVDSVKPGDHVVPVAIPECRNCANCTSGKTNMCLQAANAAPSPFTVDGKAIGSFCALGTFADHSVIPENRLAKVRDGARHDVVCYIGCGVVTGIGSALKTAAVKPGSSVVIFGMGGIGLNVLQGARIAGATRLIAVDTNARREPIARQFGATDFVNPESVADVASHIRSLTGGGADYSFECVGNVNVMLAAMNCTHPAWGTAVCVGVPGDGAKITFDPSALMTGRSWKGAYLGGEKARTMVPQLVDWYISGFIKLDELITHRLPLTDINRGFDMMKSGEAIRSVVVHEHGH